MFFSNIRRVFFIVSKGRGTLKNSIIFLKYPDNFSVKRITIAV